MEGQSGSPLLRAADRQPLTSRSSLQDEAQKLLYKHVSFNFDDQARPSDGFSFLGAFLERIFYLGRLEERVEAIELGNSAIQASMAIQACPLLPRLRRLSGLVWQGGALGAPLPALSRNRPAVSYLGVAEGSVRHPSLSKWVDLSRLQTLDLLLAISRISRMSFGAPPRTWSVSSSASGKARRCSSSSVGASSTSRHSGSSTTRNLCPAVSLSLWPKLYFLGLGHPDVAPFLAAGHPSLQELCFFGFESPASAASQASEVNVSQLADNVKTICQIVRTDPRRFSALRKVSLWLHSNLYAGAPPGWDTVRRTEGFAAMAQMVQRGGLRFGFVLVGADGHEWEERWPTQRWAQLPERA